jgi:hypothetical protein
MQFTKALFFGAIASIITLGNQAAKATTLTPINLQSYTRSGFVSQTSQGINISNASGAQTIPTLNNFLKTNLTGLGTEGSAATWNVGKGNYEITWQLYTEDKLNLDYFGVWNGIKLVKLGDRTITTRISSAANQSAIYKTIISTNQSISLFTLDTGTRTGNSVGKVFAIKRRVPEPSLILGIVLLAISSKKIGKVRSRNL